MAKKSLIVRDERNKIKNENFSSKISLLRDKIKKATSFEEYISFSKNLIKYRRFSKTRLVGRCFLTGRSKGVLHKKSLSLCRFALREQCLIGNIPGVVCNKR